MPKQSVSPSPILHFSHLSGCATCANQTRSRAYRWLGINNPIPAMHGTTWLAEDLRSALDQLEPGQGIELDYTGAVENAPRIALYCSRENVVSASGPARWLEVPGRTSWMLPASNATKRNAWLASMLLSFLTRERGAKHVVVVRRPTRQVARRSEA